MRHAGRAGAVLWLAPLATCKSGRDAIDAGGVPEVGPRASTDTGRDAARMDAQLGADASFPRDASSADAGTFDARVADADASHVTATRDADTRHARDASADTDTDAEATSPAGGGPCDRFLTPLDDFPALFGGQSTLPDWQLPELTREGYRLSISGLVETPLDLSLGDLEGASQVTVLGTLQCVYGARGTALWTGIPLRALLDRAGIDRGAAKRILVTGADGFLNNLRLADVYGEPADPPRPEPLLVLAIDHQPLPQRLGYPLRLLLPGRYGFKSVKWLTRIEVTEDDSEAGQYQHLGFSDTALMAPNVRYEGDRDLHLSGAGPITLCVRALSGVGAIASVEISIDGTPFVPARTVPLEDLLSAAPALAEAVQVQSGWDFPFVAVATVHTYDWEATPGRHTIALRARDDGARVADGYEITVTVDS